MRTPFFFNPGYADLKVSRWSLKMHTNNSRFIISMEEKAILPLRIKGFDDHQPICLPPASCPTDELSPISSRDFRKLAGFVGNFNSF